MEDPDIQLFCVHLDQCDPKKCTSLKLKKFNLVNIRKKLNQCPSNALILDPFSSKELSMDDKEAMEKYGLIVIDCSWEKTDSIFTQAFRTGRKLPQFLAANPINYGKWEKLSSVEALAAALLIIGKNKQAELILSKYNWGITFLKLNGFMEDNSYEEIGDEIVEHNEDSKNDKSTDKNNEETNEDTNKEI
jgi:pre-rRNA-processing protein TSR3